MAYIQLGGRRGPVRGYAQVDDADLVLLEGRTWYLDASGYAQSESLGERVRLHRLIMQPPAGVEVDHRNGDRLDCRRANLALVTHQQNTQHQHTAKGRYRGVYLDPRDGSWYGQVKHNGVKHCVSRDKDREVVRAAVEALRLRLGFYCG